MRLARFYLWLEIGLMIIGIGVDPLRVDAQTIDGLRCIAALLPPSPLVVGQPGENTPAEFSEVWENPGPEVRRWIALRRSSTDRVEILYGWEDSPAGPGGAIRGTATVLPDGTIRWDLPDGRFLTLTISAEVASLEDSGPLGSSRLLRCNAQ